jgi:hypothetical protein
MAITKRKSVAPIGTVPDKTGRERESLSYETQLNVPGGSEEKSMDYDFETKIIAALNDWKRRGKGSVDFNILSQSANTFYVEIIDDSPNDAKEFIEDATGYKVEKRGGGKLSVMYPPKQRKSMKARYKGIDDAPLEEADEMIEEDRDMAAEGKGLDEPQESYGAQVTRHLHNRHKTALLENEEFAKMLDHGETEAHLEKDSEHHANQLDKLEKHWNKHFAHKGYPDLEDADEELEESAEEKDLEDGDDAVSATGDDELPEIADDPAAVKSMLVTRAKRLARRIKSLEEGEDYEDKKSLRKRYKSVCAECADEGKESCHCNDAKSMDEEEAMEVKQLRSRLKKLARRIKDLEDLEDDKCGMKGLDDEDMDKIEEVKAFFKDAADPDKPFGEEEKKLAFHYHKTLEGIRAKNCKSEFPGDLEWLEEEGIEGEHKDLGGNGENVTEDAEMIEEASKCLKFLSEEEEPLNDVKREACMKCYKALDAMGQMEEMDDIAEVQEGEVGTMGEKDFDEMDEMDDVAEVQEQKRLRRRKGMEDPIEEMDEVVDIEPGVKRLKGNIVYRTKRQADEAANNRKQLAAIREKLKV